MSIGCLPFGERSFWAWIEIREEGHVIFIEQVEIQGPTTKLKSISGVSNFLYNQEIGFKDGYNSFIQRGSFNLEDNPMKFINCGYQKELIFHHMNVIYRMNDEDAQQTAERMLTTIQLD